MKLRSFQLSDIHSVQAIWKQNASREREAETLIVLSRQLAYDRDLVLVAEIEGQVVGAIVGTMEKNVGFFYCLAVHPAFQGRGVGRQLTTMLEDRFRSKGVTEIQAVIDEGTEKLCPFYTHMGYQGVPSSRLVENNWLFNLQESLHPILS
ncbi:Predicted N-acetyltransferase YhbS [Marininema mesophilum]|uniref:Predicted N-acetyltransferase YhbS n=1 Tax=Marininema mesophilum TaxID=1048340 RepID=A0A1H2WFM6_9BACL|nr:GNAT family N-acetyltransferase [Marininema mesophilum]SDW79410.1 Predicted N-acetyltransferase YhbS [Marininema mesophilum]